MTAAPTLLDVFHRSDASHDWACTPAIHVPGPPTSVTLSYVQLHRQCARLASQLQHGLQLERGAVVTLVLPNGPLFVASFLACAGLGWIAAPLNHAYNAEEVRFYVEDTRSSVVIVPAGWSAEGRPAVQAARALGCRVLELAPIAAEDKGDGATLDTGAIWQAQPDDVALVLHTSGTTGRPKCVPLTHRNIRTTMDNVVRTYQLTRSDCTLIVMPLFHVHGLIASLLSTLQSGGACAVPPRFSASAFWPHVQAFNVTWYSAVPTIHSILLRHTLPDPLPKLRFIRSASSSLAPHTLKQLEEALQAPVLEAYAMTEAAHQMCSNPLPPAVHKPGTVGPAQGVELTVRDEQGREVAVGEQGEVCVRGANVTAGYRDNPTANRDAFFPDGHWFRTGDRGKLDADGYLSLTGRIKELINRGGEKISPIEVDAALLSCAGVKDAVSFAAPDELYGEVVHCAVVSDYVSDETDSGAAAEVERIRAHCAEKLSAFKVPARVYLMRDIPKTATGKVQRRLVAAKVGTQA
ncbi:hypothetical protein THASP1DRAFT_34709 [Thamnocephalis sphaerospora]|uniref:Peroxisomal-coenzyme A synthetase n=1 Tax=Thamnocephalis sphaerospora TaxID=78915 RepID=A0A4P9XQI9_9FUNG|nr:hypothetical protein THASP1DRAFT_34709 [Thamnocephalis sphaerospora]|eukprot:RKP08306.1 hypothetical protein THASP1DRAFT_34709 [Thamnocephalis sphaerospora]